jgi:transcriptional regulator with XRE-family HTH domain
MILPTPDEIRRAREEVGLTERQAAKLVHVSPNAWQRYEASTTSEHYLLIPGAAWELFLLRTEKLRPASSGFSFDRSKGPPTLSR